MKLVYFHSSDILVPDTDFHSNVPPKSSTTDRFQVISSSTAPDLQRAPFHVINIGHTFIQVLIDQTHFKEWRLSDCRSLIESLHKMYSMYMKLI